MMEYSVFNELSLPFKTQQDAGDGLRNFVRTFAACAAMGQSQLRVHKKIGIGSSFFRQIVDHLKLLNTFAGKWTAGGFNNKVLKQYGLNVSGESEQTMQKYGRLRKFKLPDGRKEYFEKHIKTGALRFHFFADIKEHKIYVGYIGSHLPTVTN